MALGVVVPAQGEPQRHCPRFLDSRLRGNDEGCLKPVVTPFTDPTQAIRVYAPMTSLNPNAPFMPFVLFMVSEFSCFICGFAAWREAMFYSFARRSRMELPMTDSELAVMAITPIMGCNSPIEAIGMAATL